MQVGKLKLDAGMRFESISANGSIEKTATARNTDGINVAFGTGAFDRFNVSTSDWALALAASYPITDHINGYANYISAQTNPIGAFNVGLTRPKGASYTTTASSVTGAIKIKMPPGIPVHGMWKMTIKVYESNYKHLMPQVRLLHLYFLI